MTYGREFSPHDERARHVMTAPPPTSGQIPRPAPADPQPPAVVGGRQMAASALAYWAATGVTLLGSLVRGKFSAVYLGTTGLGVTAQLSTFTALVAAVAALGLGTGGVKLIAEARARGDDGALRNLVSFLLLAPMTVGLAFFGVVCVLARPLSRMLLDSDRYAGLLVVASIAVPMGLMLGSFQMVMQGFERARRLASLSLISAVVTTIAAVPLTVHYGLKGAVASIPLTAAATLLAFCVREPWVLRLSLPPQRLTATHRSQLVVLAGAGLVVSVLAVVSDIGLRIATVHQLGVDDNGLYQPAQMLTSLVLAQMAAGVSMVVLPRISAQMTGGRHAEALTTLERATRTSVVFVVTLVLVTESLREVFLLVFFDRAFLGVTDVLAVQLMAELPRFVASVFGVALLPAGLVRQWLVGGVISNLARLLTGLALLPFVGLDALAIAVVVQWTIMAVYAAWVLRSRLQWRPQQALGRLLLLASAVLAAALVIAVSLDPVPGGLLIGAVAVAWVMLLGRGELRHLAHALLPRGLPRRRSPAA